MGDVEQILITGDYAMGIDSGNIEEKLLVMKLIINT